ncbi:MAG: S9 family peptidase [Clostridia bacterium]|nr:S9 family peptidase [Clostridia bacterium]
MKPIDIPSLMEIRFPSGPVISPDGRHAAYIVTRGDQKENRYASCIHLLDLSTGRTRQMTHAGREGGCVWEDANTLLFTARREKADEAPKTGEKTVFYRLDITGGEAERAFEIPLRVKALKPLGGGRYAVLARVDLNAPDGDTEEAFPEDRKDYHVLEEVPFWGNGRGWISRVRSALYRFDADGGALTPLTGPFFDVEAFDVRDGRIAWAGLEYRDMAGPRSEAWLWDAESEETRRIVEGDRYQIGVILLTDRSVVLSMTDGATWGLEQLRDWYRFDIASETLRLAASMDLCIGSAGMLDCTYGSGESAVARGDAVFFVAQREYRSEIWRLGEDDVVAPVLPWEGSVLWLAASREDLLFTAHAPGGLGEIYALREGSAWALTDLNGEFLRTHFVAQAEYIPFVNGDGDRVDGWVLKPEGFDPRGRYPGVLQIHGGPRCAYGVALFHEMQVLCAAGYVVFFCNPRGSEGYGEAFADLRGRYGTVDYEDLMAFTDHVLTRVPQLDPDRLAACGGSYGGFMCNWIEGHTRRFAALASQRSVSNWISDFGASEIGLTFDKNEMGGDPWTHTRAMWDQSPLKYAPNAGTPILFIHSLEDYNCPLNQGLEMFSAMKYFGVPARMCLFEGENHSLSRSGKPRHRIRRLEEILGWFEKYCRPAR